VKTIPLTKKWKKWVGLGLMASMIGLGLPHGTAQAATGWTATYYSKTNLTGHRVNGGPYSSLNFNWGTRSPRAGVPSNNFSAVFQKKIYEYAGNYDLQVRTSQGVRVYVDGKLKINHWSINKGSYWHTPIQLSKGYHSLVVKYYKTTGKASLSLNLNQIIVKKSPTPPKLPIASDQWYGEFFPSQNLTGYPKLVGTHYTSKISSLNSNWGTNAPVSGIPKDHFSAIYQRQIISVGGNYNLQVSVDDGIQVYVDNKLQINGWFNGSHSYTKQVPLSKGTHTVLVKYFENTGLAHLKVDIAYIKPPAPTPTVSIPLTSTEWNGAYYPSQNLTGTAVLLKNTSFNYNWGTNAPATKISSGPFSAIFQKNVSFNGSPTDLEVWANNGFQVYVDGKVMIDHWTNTTDGFWHQLVTPSKGTHKVVVKYVKRNSTASLRFETGSPYRTLDLKKPANITASAITNFFKTNYPSSPLLADANSYISSQNTYGVNAVYLVAHAILETGWGKSSLSVYKNNLYGYGAYDVCPFTCAYYFPDHTSSINLVAHDVVGNYLNTTGPYYIGKYGPDLVGMNVKYASGGSWYSSIANLMEQIQPYNTSYYTSVGEKQVAAVTPPTYGRNIPSSKPKAPGNEINFPRGTSATIVNTDWVSLRTIPYVSTSTLIKSINGNVTVLGYNSDVSYKPTSTGNYKYHWYRVSANGQTDWVYGQYLNIKNLLQVNATSLNIRKSPSATAALATPTALTNHQYVQPVLNSSSALSTQTVVNSNGSKTTWYQVKVPNSTTTTGWVSGDFVKVIKN
jgi:beta-N-acetylglucosaminidase